MKKVLLLAAIFMCVGTSQANAQSLLGVYQFSEAAGQRAIITEGGISVGYAFGTDELLPTIFDNVIVNKGSVGQVFTATSTTNSNFQAFTGLLTDGIDQRIRHLARGGGSDRFESALFGSGNSVNGIDFQGFNIDRYELFIDQVSFNSPGEDPNNDGIWTDYGITASFRIYGDPSNPNVVPEPATMILFGIGMVGAFARRRKRLA